MKLHSKWCMRAYSKPTFKLVDIFLELPKLIFHYHVSDKYAWGLCFIKFCLSTLLDYDNANRNCWLGIQLLHLHIHITYWHDTQLATRGASRYLQGSAYAYHPVKARVLLWHAQSKINQEMDNNLVCRAKTTCQTHAITRNQLSVFKSDILLKNGRLVITISNWVPI